LDEEGFDYWIDLGDRREGVGFWMYLLDGMRLDAGEAMIGEWRVFFVWDGGCKMLSPEG
jgi:hypothetical protein